MNEFAERSQQIVYMSAFVFRGLILGPGLRDLGADDLP